MKKRYRLQKIKLPIFSLLFFILASYSGYGKSLLQIFLLISIHELFHILTALALRYEIASICIFPFGLSMQLDNLEFRHSIDEIMIAMAGLVSYLCSMPLLEYVYQFDYISKVNFHWLQTINTSILIFNSLPIYPLDGGRILHGLMHMIMPYRLAKKTTIICSSFCFCLISLKFVDSISMFVIVLLFLCFQLVQSWISIPIMTRLFYLHRYIHPSKYKAKYHQYDDLYRNKTNFIASKHEILSEQEWLNRRFTSSSELIKHGKNKRATLL